MTATATDRHEATFHENVTGFTDIDRENGIIRGVKIIGENSKNKRRYKRTALKEAIELYEGSRVYLNHSQGSRRTGDRWGKLQNVREAEDGLRGDLSYLKTHPETKQILESIERFRDSGLSHEAQCFFEVVGGVTVIDKIAAVKSVDFVEKPGTVQNLFEQEEEGDMPNDTNPKLVVTVLRENTEKSEAAKSIVEHFDAQTQKNAKWLQEAGVDAATVDVGKKSPLEGDAAVKAALRAIVVPLFETEGTAESAIEKLRNVFSVQEQQQAPATIPVEDIASKVIASIKESIDATVAPTLEKLTAQTETASIRTMLEQHQVAVTEERVAALLPLTEQQRIPIVMEWPKKGKKPERSKSRLSESDSEADSYDDIRSRIPALSTSES